MERVLVHDLRCENLGFSVMIFSDRGQTYERHTVTRRVSPITSPLHSTGSPLVRTPRQGSWIAGSIPRTVDLLLSAHQLDRAASVDVLDAVLYTDNAVSVQITPEHYI